MKKIKILISAMMSLLLLCASAATAFADTVYTVDGYSYTLLQTGLASLVGWDNSSETLTVPKKIGSVYVSNIGDSAFKSDDFIKSVDFSAAARMYKIGKFAFADSALEGELVIPTRITTVGVSAFEGCTGLENLSFSSDGGKVPSQCFMNCTGLKTVNISSYITTIEQYAFKNCSSLNSVTIPRSVTSINSTAFDGCGELTIVCYNNSCAMQYAIDHGIDYDVIDPLKGDFDGDGVVTVNDATYIQMNDVGMSIPFTVDKHALKRGEVTGDGEVDVRDATMIQMKLANMISSFD